MSGTSTVPFGPRRGSAAASQTRDAQGRFQKDGRSTNEGAERRRSGSAHYARMSKLELVRMLIVLDQRLVRRSVEMSDGRETSAVAQPPANMKNIRAKEAGRTAERRALLTSILLDCAENKIDPRPCDLAREMSVRLKAPFGPEQLFRPSLIDLWKPDEDYFGKLPSDRTSGALARWRMSRKLLVHHIKRTKRLLEEVNAKRGADLLAQSLVEDGWTRLPEQNGSAVSA